MQQGYTEDNSRKFVHVVNAAPEPAVVVATKLQLQDLARFCTSSFEFSILTVEPTFCLGEFDVTLTTFPSAQEVQNTASVFVGPACIHFKKSFLTYLFFVSTIIEQCLNLEGVRVVGTDGEQPLIDAFIHEFGFAQDLICFIHICRNVKN